MTAATAPRPVSVPNVTGAVVLLQLLHDHGVRFVFGIVGREGAAIRFDEVPGLDFVLVRHEQSAGIIADVYARLTGRAQACFATLGPGVTNLSTGVASAYKDRSPMWVVVAQAETDHRHPDTHQVLDNVALLRPITHLVAEPESVEDLVDAFRAGLAAMSVASRPGPVALSVPIDVLLEEADRPRARLELPPAPPAAEIDRAALDQLHAWIGEARQPLLVVGAGAQEVSAEVTALARHHGIPVASSLAGKGVLSDRDPLSLGCLTKHADWLVARGAVDAIFRAVDLVVLVGYDYGEDFTPRLWSESRPRVARIDAFPHDVPDDVPLDLDVGRGPLAESLRYLAARPATGRPIGLGAERAALHHGRAQVSSWTRPSEVNPFAAVRSIRAALADDDILVTDVGLHKHIAGLYFETYRPATYFTSNGLATMGFGLPAAMGAKLARPDRRVVAICGDGGLHSVNQELETCARHGIAVVIVVFKDGTFGLIQRYQRVGHDQHIERATRFGEVDFVKLAEAQGCRGARADTLERFEAALADALAADTTTVIEVPVQYRASYVHSPQ